MTLTKAGRKTISQAQKQRWEDYRASTTHCPQGHPWALYAAFKARGTRYCRQCNIDACRARRSP